MQGGAGVGVRFCDRLAWSAGPTPCRTPETRAKSFPGILLLPWLSNGAPLRQPQIQPYRLSRSGVGSAVVGASGRLSSPQGTHPFHDLLKGRGGTVPNHANTLRNV